MISDFSLIKDILENRSDSERKADKGISGQVSGITSLILMGLADGINPCAFYCICVLVLAMTRLKKTRKELALLCASFAGGMFASYFVLGLMFEQSMRWIRRFSILKEPFEC